MEGGMDVGGGGSVGGLGGGMSNSFLINYSKS